MSRIKKSLPGFFIILVSCLLLTILYYRDALLIHLSSNSTSNKTGQPPVSVAQYVDSAYNYDKNKPLYKVTYLEFGSTGCRECKKMEKVMDSVKTNYPSDVNVIFLNVNEKENKGISDSFSIRLIPAQVLLDFNGKEVFRNSGYISYRELSKELDAFLHE